MPPTSAKCVYHDELKADTERIIKRLGNGDVTLATLGTRLDAISEVVLAKDENGQSVFAGIPRRVASLERVVYGAVALTLTAVVIAVLALVIKGN